MKDPYLVTVKYTVTKDVIVYGETEEDAVAEAYDLDDNCQIEASVFDDITEVECICQGHPEQEDYDSPYVQIFDEEGNEVL